MRNKKEIQKKTEEIRKGMVVAYDDPKDGGNYRVTKVTKTTVNLGAIFGKHIYYKGVDIKKVTNDEEAWYERWTKSDAYQCM